MFGYKLIKEEEIEALKNKLEDAVNLINEQKNKIIELDNKNKEYEKTIANLTKPTTVKNDSKTESKEEKPVKKVRRKYTKKNTKKED
jgi:hypothetical protein